MLQIRGQGGEGPVERARLRVGHSTRPRRENVVAGAAQPVQIARRALTVAQPARVLGEELLAEPLALTQVVLFVGFCEKGPTAPGGVIVLGPASSLTPGLRALSQLGEDESRVVAELVDHGRGLCAAGRS